MAMKKMSKLSKLKMPSDSEEKFEIGGKHNPEEEASESPMEESAEQSGEFSPEDGEEEMMSLEDSDKSEGPAAELSDDELLAEIKKRGLMSELERGDKMMMDHEAPASDEEEY